LQHGSIILANRFDQQTTASLTLPFEESIEKLRASFSEAVADTFEMNVEAGSWSDSERLIVDTLVKKYSDDKWTHRM